MSCEASLHVRPGYEKFGRWHAALGNLHCPLSFQSFLIAFGNMRVNIKSPHHLLPQTRPKLSQVFGSRIPPRKRSAVTILAAVKVGDKAPDFVLKDQVAIPAELPLRNVPSLLA